MANNYVNNAELLRNILIYRECLAVEDRASTKFRRAENYFGNCVLIICKNLMKKHEFYGKYHFEEEMRGNAASDVAKYFHNFDPIKYNNPFSYITQICYHAFIRVIMKEKKDYRMKQAMIIQSGILEKIDVTQEGDDTSYANGYVDYLKSYIDKHGETSEAVEKQQKEAKQIVVKKKGRQKKANVDALI